MTEQTTHTATRREFIEREAELKELTETALRELILELWPGYVFHLADRELMTEDILEHEFGAGAVALYQENL